MSWVWIWTGVLILAMVIEIITMGLTSIWFAGGAIVALICAALKAPVWLQVVAFLIVSAVLIWFTRPVAVKYFNKARTKTNVDALIGKRAIVVSPIDNLQGIGMVTVGGNEWSATCEHEGKVIPEGSVVIVKEVRGVKLVVEIDETTRQDVKLTDSEGLLDPGITND